MKKPFPLNKYLFAAIAKIWRWYPPRREVINRVTRFESISGKKEKKEFNQCEKCKEWFEKRKGKKRGIEVDHIVPKIAPDEGFVGWDNYIRRCFVLSDKLQALCLSCHKEKSKKENAIRRKQRGETK